MPKKRRLKTIEDVRRYLATILLRAESGELDAQIAGRLAYISNILLKAIHDGDLEKRIADLEIAMQKK
ncbi:MAG: hypothetical protein HGA63_04995 [Syntrophobacteraceae bacterium]|nr:hypothetical protein [Syntrophobacteraceae bacterium]